VQPKILDGLIGDRRHDGQTLHIDEYMSVVAPSLISFTVPGSTLRAEIFMVFLSRS